MWKIIFGGGDEKGVQSGGMAAYSYLFSSGFLM
jgi:hypothetical protein